MSIGRIFCDDFDSDFAHGRHDAECFACHAKITPSHVNATRRNKHKERALYTLGSFSTKFSKVLKPLGRRRQMKLDNEARLEQQTIQPQIMDRSKGLRKLGVTEEDVKQATKLLEESSRLRSKALNLLGTSEEEVELEFAKNLGSLGIAGRRRSHSMLAAQNHNEILAFTRAIPRPRANSIFKKLMIGFGDGNGSKGGRRHTSTAVKRRKSSIDKQSSTLRRRSSDSELTIKKGRKRSN